MVDFAAHLIIHAIKIGFQKSYILPGKCGCQSEHSPLLFPSRYIVLAIRSLLIAQVPMRWHLAAEKRLRVT